MGVKKKSENRDWSGLRLILLGAAFFLLLIGLWSKAYYIQVLKGSKLEKRAEDQHWSKKTAYGERGEIYDSKGNLLAKSVLVHSVFARPDRVQNPVRAKKILSGILDLDPRIIKSKLRKDSNFIWIVRQIGASKSKKIRDAKLKGIHLIEKHRRYYPQGHLAGQLLGCVGIDNNGLEGLELSFDKYLKGKKKEFLVCKDATGRLIDAPGNLHRDLSGKDLVLTLDCTIQYTAEKALARAVKKYQGESGVCLVIKVDSGNILAMANYPFFNPNNYRQSTPGTRRNRSILDVFEPGSTLKPILVASALEEDICTKNELFFCENGRWRVQGKYIRDTHDYGKLPVHNIIKYSSNIGASKIGLQVGRKRYYSYLKSLGANKGTDLPLPGENTGILRPPEKWTKTDLVSASFGQGLSMNSLQLARMYNCIANKGIMKDLNIVKEPHNGPGRNLVCEGNLVCEKSRLREKKHIRIFSQKTAVSVLKMLRSVVEQNGTGTRTRISGLQVGGKTGTAQKSGPHGYKNEYVAAFVGLFPAMNPEYLVLTIVDEPKTAHYGGVVAAPVVKNVGQELLASKDDLQRKYLDKQKKSPNQASTPGGEGAYDVVVQKLDNPKSTNDGKHMPNIKNKALRTALEFCARRGVMPEIRGQGKIVKKQSPSPGTPLKKARDCTIWIDGYSAQH